VLTFDQAQARAREWLARIKASVASAEAMTVEDACAKYLEYIKAERRSYRNDSCKVRVHINPVLGKRRVAELTVDELEAWKRGLVRVRPDGPDDGTPWTTDSHNKLLRRTVPLAKLPKGTCLYTCRHTHTTECIRNGMNLITLAENLGTSVKMLEDHYVKLSDDATGEVVEAHGFKLGLHVAKEPSAAA
jgi:integrase